MRKGSLKTANGEILAQLESTETAAERMRGLLGRKDLDRGSALWISPCTSIHTFFMKFPIDVIFLNRHGIVISLYRSLKPWRLSWWHPLASGVVEAAAGSIDVWKVKIGDRLDLCIS